MKKLMLIGGGDTRKETYSTKAIDEEIVKMTSKEKPNFLFIGLANSYADSYYDCMKNIYKGLGCTTVYLKKNNIIHNPNIVKKKIKEADIIYIGGGDTIKLLDNIKEYKIDVLLKEAYEEGTVLAGMSAGAILLSKDGFSDSKIIRNESDKHVFVDGLNFINISFCPHYNELKKKELTEELNKNNKEIYCLENCTALKIIDNNIDIVKSNKDSKVYVVTKNTEKEI